MILTRKNIALFLALFWLACTTPVQVPDQTDPIEQIDFAYIQDEGKLYVGAWVKNPFNGARINYVNVAWFGTKKIDAAAPDSVILSDNGDQGDIVKGDNLYAKRVKASSLANAIAYTDTGRVYLKVVAHYEGDENYELADSFSLGNIMPRFLWIDAPDTLTLPDSGLAQLITVRAKAEDANGLDDIHWMGFTSKRLSDGVILNDGNYIYMVDTGDTTYGDVTKGDGIFTATIMFPYNASTGQLEWRFRVQDWKGGFQDSSKTVLVQK